jgi:hypothetical protein
VTDDEHKTLQEGKTARDGTSKTLMWVGAFILLTIIFGVPAVLVPSSMQNVPIRSETKAITNYQHAVDIVQGNFKRHEDNQNQRRLMPLPQNTTQWIQLINPTGRKAPGGGFAFLPQANTETGAIGLQGSAKKVTITLPAYRSLTEESSTLIPGTTHGKDADE